MIAVARQIASTAVGQKTLTDSISPAGVLLMLLVFVVIAFCCLVAREGQKRGPRPRQWG